MGCFTVPQRRLWLPLWQPLWFAKKRWRNAAGQRIRFTSGPNAGKRMHSEECCCFSLTTCGELETCGPSGVDISDADFELEISGVGNGDCTSTGCSALNSTFLTSAPQTGLGCACLGAIDSTDQGCGDPSTTSWGWLIAPPGCAQKVGQSWHSINTTNWRVEAWAGFDAANPADSVGAVFELDGAAGAAAVQTLCGGGAVALPLVEVGGPFSPICDFSGATANLTSIY